MPLFQRKAGSLVLLLGWTLLSTVQCQREKKTRELAPLPAAQVAVPDLEARRRLALSKSSGGQPVDALLASLQESIAQNPGKLDSWVLLGRAWVRKARESAEPGYYQNADACADVALHIAPDSALALDLRGMVLLNDHRFSEALQLAQRAIAKDAADSTAYGTLSDALLELGKYDEAVAAAQQMMALKPNLPSYSRASYLTWLRGDTKLAKELIRQAIDASSPSARDPEPRAWALVQAAHLFWQEGDYGGADAGYELALRSFADYPPALLGRGRAALSQNRPQEAVTFLEKSYRLSPLLETAWLLAEAKDAAGDNKGAEAVYDLVVRQGRRTDPRTLALFLTVHRRDPPEALRLIEEERKKRGDVYTQDVYAFVLYSAGRVAEARAAIEPLLRLGVPDSRILYHGGAILLAAGEKERAAALLQEALRKNPKFDVRGAADAEQLRQRAMAK